MKKFIPLFLLVLILLFGCGDKATKSTALDENEAQFSFPTQGINVSGHIYFTVTGTNIDKVHFIWHGSVTTDETAPYRIYCVTTSYSNGEHTVRATVEFDDGSSTSFTVDFWINN